MDKEDFFQCAKRLQKEYDERQIRNYRECLRITINMELIKNNDTSIKKMGCEDFAKYLDKLTDERIKNLKS
jgi:CO dehydrogenase/acetyl-CoA synthase epsilon subunit